MCISSGCPKLMEAGAGVLQQVCGKKFDDLRNIFLGKKLISCRYINNILKQV